MSERLVRQLFCDICNNEIDDTKHLRVTIEEFIDDTKHLRVTIEEFSAVNMNYMADNKKVAHICNRHNIDLLKVIFKDGQDEQ